MSGIGKKLKNLFKKKKSDDLRQLLKDYDLPGETTPPRRRRRPAPPPPPPVRFESLNQSGEGRRRRRKRTQKHRKVQRKSRRIQRKRRYFW